MHEVTALVSQPDLTLLARRLDAAQADKPRIGPPPDENSPVPEPSMLLQAAIGLAGMATFAPLNRK